MKLLLSYSDNAAFETDKEKLEDTYDDYAALAVEERDNHLKEIPDMADIALWDATDERIVMVRGWDYNADAYPFDRYTAIGIEVIPRTHMIDGYTRIMSLDYMRYDTPKNGGEKQNMVWGMNRGDIEDYEMRTYAPAINENGTNDFGDTQEIKRWFNVNQAMKYLPSDAFTGLANPFTKNQGYFYNDRPTSNFCPSPYSENMLANPIYFTENPDKDNPSLFLDFDGKGKTKKILDQLAVNIGNEDWKTGKTIENATGVTNAPAAQCCWMYSTVGTNQGDWYLPTLSELIYICARQNAIINSINQINAVKRKVSSLATFIDYLWSSNSTSNTQSIYFFYNDGYYSTITRNSSYSVRAFCLV